MINVSTPELKLVEDLKAFTDKCYDILTYVCAGMELSESILSSDNAKKDISNLKDKLSELSEIISSFKIGIDSTKHPDKLWIVWDKTGSSDQYYYRGDKVLTEKMLAYIIMSFEKEICKRLSVIEATNNGYLYFCSRIKDPIHKIISDYMNA